MTAGIRVLDLREVLPPGEISRHGVRISNRADLELLSSLIQAVLRDSMFWAGVSIRDQEGLTPSWSWTTEPLKEKGRCRIVRLEDIQMHGANEIIREASELPVEERALVIDSLLRTLNSPDPTLDQEWVQAAKRRLLEIRSGAVQSVPGNEVFGQIRDRFAK